MTPDLASAPSESPRPRVVSRLVEVTAGLPPGEAVRLAVDVHLPASAAPGLPALYCLPGGTMTRAYHDLDVPEDPTYSFARHMAAAGFCVLVADHPGIGDSTSPSDPFDLTVPAVAGLHDAACRTLVRELREGSGIFGAPRAIPATVGLGHSMGGMLTVVQQDRHHTHAAIVLLGFGTAGLPEALGAAELAASESGPPDDATLDAWARDRYGAAFVDVAHSGHLSSGAGRTGPGVKAALARARGPLWTVGATLSVTPGSVAAEAARIDVPVFLGNGAHDPLIRNPHGIPATFAASPDITSHVLADAGHNHHAAPTRAALWDRIAAWLRGFASTDSSRTTTGGG